MQSVFALSKPIDDYLSTQNPFGMTDGELWFTIIVGGILVILNLWALKIVIRAGHRYLSRTEPPKHWADMNNAERATEMERRERAGGQPTGRRAAQGDQA